MDMRLLAFCTKQLLHAPFATSSSAGNAARQPGPRQANGGLINCINFLISTADKTQSRDDSEHRFRPLIWGGGRRIEEMGGSCCISNPKWPLEAAARQLATITAAHMCNLPLVCPMQPVVTPPLYCTHFCCCNLQLSCGAR